MIVLPPYISDAEAYLQLPVENRWIMNKLSVAERLGYVCGPSGVSADAGKYCVRPIMNVLGMARGGFFMAVSDVPFNPDLLPGYFWCEWFEGSKVYTSYIDDEPVAYSSSTVNGNIMRTTVATKTRSEGAAAGSALPDMFKGISKYLMVEQIGDKIIEVSPRLMAMNARQFIIDDYKTIDPGYDPKEEDGEVSFGNSDAVKQAATWDAGDGNVITGWKWGSPNTDRRPF